MNERKKNVMEDAHALFVEKGYAATSVQDILEKSGISKGTFYNYFLSKSELLISIFEKINSETDERRAQIIAGRPVHDKQAFMDQIKVKMEVNKENNLFALFQGVFVSEEEELKKFVKQHHFNELRWMQRRFVEVFGENIYPYSADLSLMMFGMVQNMIHFSMAAEEMLEVEQIIAYAMRRAESAINNIVETNDQLLQPEVLDRWQPKKARMREKKKSALMQQIGVMQKQSKGEKAELLAFLQDEFRGAVPRRHVIDAVIARLSGNDRLTKLVNDFFDE